MGTSNNPLDHPLLWNQQLKRIQEKRIADASLRDWQHRKHLERQARAKEQAHYREVMERYSPWGRKGGGAPNDTVRMRNIQLQGLYPETKNFPTTPLFHATRRQDFRNPVPMQRPKGVSAGGGGAPLRNSSGQIVTGLTDDPIISFNDANRYHVDNDLRYRTTPAQKQSYRAALDRIVADKENRRKTRSSDLDAKVNGGPWGKPGPGGKPWRPPKNVGQNFMKSMGWTNKETLQDLDIEVVTKMQRQLEEENRYLKKFSNCCSRCVCQCVSNSLDPPRSGSGSAQMPRATNSPPKSQVVPPATAPSQAMRDDSNPSTDKITDRRVMRLCQQNQQTTPGRAPVAKRAGAKVVPTRNCMITGGVELVPLLAKRRSQARPISLGTTDVTKIDKYSSNGTSAVVVRQSGDEYLHELCTQMNQKQRKIERTRVVEFETSKQHFETWSGFWGRPGHGAPLPNKNKLNLDNLLYAPPR
ncbi:uncharacterized protein LOC129725530 isoform X2 [Wyeomyia smithii]|uniref:uncharacterized protein LOC129725530 isoform X2 n=1 Tax=Wyeomyia smithii TaxID=174621 RepID=UPI002467D0D2|nr:uncharacterized protein LOC129725530 isoform X2 [Wyeomyia smithii]